MKTILTHCDAYKISHKFLYPEKTEMVYSNWTIRGSRTPRINSYVFYGLQYFIKEYLINKFNKEFFNLPKDEALNPFKRRIKNYLGDIDLSHFDRLHDLGYLPIEIKALEEGDVIPLKVPCMTIYNTHPDFYWVTNYLETIMSCTIWGAINSATTGYYYSKIRDKYLEETCDDVSMRNFLMHDFSYRGMFNNEGAMVSGSAFLLSSHGSDTIPAVDFLEEYYNANSDNELVAVSVPASEHSTQSAGGKENEFQTYKNIITKIYPEGIVSVVSDTWDYYGVITEILPALKNEIMTRNGKLVLRPDSSLKTPLEIICGDKTLSDKNSPEYKGSIELLYELFGGTINSKGYKILDPHVGLIYGEAISMDLYESICETLKKQGFASSNFLIGVGSMSFTLQTRDNLSQACKATACVIDGKLVEITKEPKTDSGLKKSAKGLLAVYKNDSNEFYLKDQATWDEANNCELKTVFKDGKLIRETSLSEIRERLNNSRK